MKENPYGDMDQPAYRVAYLIAGYIRKTLSEKEHDELDNWVNESDHNMQLFEDLTDERNLEANLEWMDKVQTEQSYKQLLESGAFKKPAKRLKLNRAWLAVAAVVLLGITLFIFRTLSNKEGKNKEMANADTIQLKPGGNRATLTFADSSKIDLTTAKNGLMKNDNGADIVKLGEGIILYDPHNTGENSSSVHTLSTPAGGQFQITLPDGTKVWLNAATILKYPSKFISNERKVELDGEAYFEVAKNEKLPFRVVLSDSSVVTVLGTHFNVMSYNNEREKAVTLLEGSVTVSKKADTKQLEPGMQASISGNEITTHTGVDTEEITAWKNGLFVFHDASIETIMNQVTRWYDAEVVYKGEIKQQFNATILRNEPLSKLLHLLELNGYVHFKIENKTIYVLP